ncbi:MAG: hypothetical protein KAW17_13165 [Candidatus Eisenbacteria sp.]|nr:hypothetical protein [Candidatus Eisenbacteria bacterium]
MPREKDKEVQEIKIRVNEALPTVLVDNLTVSPRSDGLYLMHFTTSFPDRSLKEEARLVVPRDSLKRMLDVLCRICDYYPTKPKSKAKKRPKSN